MTGLTPFSRRSAPAADVGFGDVANGGEARGEVAAEQVAVELDGFEAQALPSVILAVA